MITSKKITGAQQKENSIWSLKEHKRQRQCEQSHCKGQPQQASAMDCDVMQDVAADGQTMKTLKFLLHKFY